MANLMTPPPSSLFHTISRYSYPTFTSLLAYLRVYITREERNHSNFPSIVANFFRESLVPPESRPTETTTRLNDNRALIAPSCVSSLSCMPSNGAESRKRGYNGCVRDECWSSSVAIIIETFLKRRALEIYFSNKPIFYRFVPPSILSRFYL